PVNAQDPVLDPARRPSRPSIDARAAVLGRWRLRVGRRFLDELHGLAALKLLLVERLARGFDAGVDRTRGGGGRLERPVLNTSNSIHYCHDEISRVLFDTSRAGLEKAETRMAH